MSESDKQTPQQDLQQELRRLEAELADREAALPAHTVRPHQIIEIEDLEERIADLKRRLDPPHGKGIAKGVSG